MEEEDLKTYIFCHKNSSIVITISSICFDNAEMELYDLGIDTEEFRCDDKEGESELNDGCKKCGKSTFGNICGKCK